MLPSNSKGKKHLKELSFTKQKKCILKIVTTQANIIFQVIFGMQNEVKKVHLFCPGLFNPISPYLKQSRSQASSGGSSVY